jgi:hypothetical protein
MKNKKGLTLIETIINIYIYVLLISVCATISMVYIKNRSVLRQKQQAIEEMSMMILDIVKDVRMSKCDGAGGNCIPSGLSNELTIKTNKDDKKIIYKISTDNKLIKNYDGMDYVMLENVSGYFSSVRDDGSSIPLIRIRLFKTDKNGDPVKNTKIYNSVSLRSGYETENMVDFRDRSANSYDGSPMSQTEVQYKFPEAAYNLPTWTEEDEEASAEPWLDHPTSEDEIYIP